jgi:hypothetical protein
MYQLISSNTAEASSNGVSGFYALTFGLFTPEYIAYIEKLTRELEALLTA